MSRAEAKNWVVLNRDTGLWWMKHCTWGLFRDARELTMRGAYDVIESAAIGPLSRNVAVECRVPGWEKSEISEPIEVRIGDGAWVNPQSLSMVRT